MTPILTRESARAGISLVQAGGLPPLRGETAAAAVPQTPPAAPAPVAGKSAELAQIILPSVRDRWMTGLIGMYTPTLIENTIRGAMAGNLMSLWLMFDLMERTWPRLSKNLNELKTAVIAMGWNMQPFAMKGQKPTPEARRRARIMEQMIWTMRPDLERNENDFEDTLYDIMDGLGKGVALLQTDFERRPVNIATDPKKVQMQELWCPRSTQWVHPRYYGYPAGSGKSDRLMLNVREVKQNNPGADLPTVDGTWAEIPRQQFIVSIFKQKSGHPLGGSMLAILGYWWAAHTFTWDWFLNFAQIFGMPIRWATYAPNIPGQSIQDILAMLQQMGSTAYAAFPQGTNLELKTGATDARNVPHKVLIDAADTICDIIVLGQTLTTTQGSHGSQALGNVHNEVRQEKIAGVAGRAAKILNVQWLPSICTLNFGDDSECPRLVPADTKGKDALAVASRYKIILSTPGVRVSKDQYYEENDLVVPDDDDDDVLTASAGGGQTQPGKPGGNGNDGPDDLEVAQAGSRQPCCSHHAKAAAANRHLVDNALADATGIAPRWLGAVRPVFEGLIAKAKDSSLSDADLIAAIERAKKDLPEVFEKMDHDALGRVIEDAMAAATVTGAVRGSLRRPGTRQSASQEKGVAA